MVRPSAIFGLAVVCLCASVFAEAAGVPPSATSSDAPVPTVTLTGQDDGKDIDLTTGGILIVKLKSNPSTGYKWTVAGDPSPLRLTKSSYVKNSHSSQAIGGSGVQVLRFTAASAGMANLTIVYRRSWEYNVPPAKTFTIRVDIR